MSDPIYPYKHWENQMDLWYLAHPMQGDGFFTFEENKQHALDMQEMLWKVGIKAVNTWYSFSIIFGVGEGPDMERYLALDMDVINAFGGIILTGHNLSSGMIREFSYALEKELRIMNLIGVPDRYIGQLVKEYVM
ncbi:hypothetical protein LCGC14_2018660 [marine sediment metagenome]|uniref:Uncharacterized protein n=1 Tax=marine sediment metagenome TaxID=412755 RepID=A0A0F9FKN9_9ZZZZ